MPSGDVTSLNAFGGNADHGAWAFTTTHWSMVLEAQGESPAAQEALEKLCRTYWRPIFSFVRRQGARPEDAEDLTQGFFALLLERKDLNAVRQEKGRLRSYLLRRSSIFWSTSRAMLWQSSAAKGDAEICPSIRHRSQPDWL